MTEIGADSLAVQPDGPDTAVAFALTRVRRLYVRRGRSSRWKDAAVGAAGGAVGGLPYAALLDAMLGEDFDVRYDRSVLVGAASGLASGLIFGGQERWKRVAVPRASVAPGRGNVDVGLSFSVPF